MNARLHLRNHQNEANVDQSETQTQKEHPPGMTQFTIGRNFSGRIRVQTGIQKDRKQQHQIEMQRVNTVPTIAHAELNLTLNPKNP